MNIYKCSENPDEYIEFDATSQCHNPPQFCPCPPPCRPKRSFEHHDNVICQKQGQGDLSQTQGDQTQKR